MQVTSLAFTHTPTLVLRQEERCAPVLTRTSIQRASGVRVTAERRVLRDLLKPSRAPTTPPQPPPSCPPAPHPAGPAWVWLLVQGQVDRLAPLP